MSSDIVVHDKPTNENNVLAKILDAHKISVLVDNDQIKFKGTDVAMQALVFPSSDERIIQLDVCVKSPSLLSERVIIESFAGVGDTYGDAVRNAFEKFCMASLHVLLSVFVDQNYGEDQVDWAQWKNGKYVWNVCLGPLLQWVNRPPEQNPALIDESPIHLLQDAFLKEATYQVHWLRYYYGFLNGKQNGRDVLLDNQSWQPGEFILDRWPWPALTGYYSFRHFLIALPVQSRNK